MSFSKPSNWNNLPIYEKIKIYAENLTEEYSQYVDKINSKLIVKKICGENIQIPKIIKILKSPNDIKQNDLQPNYIIKSAHASGWNINIDSNTKINDVHKTLNLWNTKYNPHYEKQYSFLNPTFFIEEKINDSILGLTGNAIVYMIRCIHSKPISIGVKYKYDLNSYDIEWNEIQKPQIKFVIPKPKKLDLMLEMASLLSSNFEFVRIDFYINANDDIYFSEFTFTPASGNKVYDDINIEFSQGMLWK